MLIHLTGEMRENLADLLNRKRGDKVVALRRAYSIREFAQDIGMNDRTLARLMDLTKPFEGLDAKSYRALYAAFKDEFLRALGNDPDAEPTFRVDKEPAPNA